MGIQSGSSYWAAFLGPAEGRSQAGEGLSMRRGSLDTSIPTSFHHGISLAFGHSSRRKRTPQEECSKCSSKTAVALLNGRFLRFLYPQQSITRYCGGKIGSVFFFYCYYYGYYQLGLFSFTACISVTCIWGRTVCFCEGGDCENGGEFAHHRVVYLRSRSALLNNNNTLPIIIIIIIFLLLSFLPLYLHL